MQPTCHPLDEAPMSLAELRSNPADACNRYVYRTGPNPGSFSTHGAIVEGGMCTIAQKAISAGFYDLKAVATGYAGTDYFYPWLQRGIGWVQVPKSAPDGTIVMTGGVNGCTIVVTELLSNYFFYHDGDSSHLYPGLTTGREVARIAPQDYDPGDAANTAFQQALARAAASGQRPSGDLSYGHYVIAVKSKARFGLYATGLMSLNGLSRLASGDSSCLATFG